MGGRWVTWVAVSSLANSALAFVSCPTGGGSTSCSSKITSLRYAAEASTTPLAGGIAPAAAGSPCGSSGHFYGTSGSRSSYAGASSAPGWASSWSFQQPGTRKSSCRRRRGGRACSSLGMKTKLETEVAGQEHAYEVVFVRHGQSTWNKANRFIGWTDAELTEEGEIEARVAGQLLLSYGFEFDIMYTSMLKRAIKTAWLVLDELNQQHVPVTTDWHLNERCYGALVGREKKECVRVFGADQVKTWRRSWDVPPPPIDKSSKLWPGNNPKYKFLSKDGESQVPVHESLKDVMARSSAYWEEVIAPSVRSGKRVCICGHENNLRSLLKYLDGISNTDIVHVELPRAVPLVYYLDEDLRPVGLAGAAPHLSGEYVGDPEEIAAIQERDLKNVYDLSVSSNLEEVEEPRFAAKLDELAQPCEVDDGTGEGSGEEDDEFSGSFLETGVGDDKCRTSKALLQYNRGAGKKKEAAVAASAVAVDFDEDDGASSDSSGTSSDSSGTSSNNGSSRSNDSSSGGSSSSDPVLGSRAAVA